MAHTSEVFMAQVRRYARVPVGGSSGRLKRESVLGLRSVCTMSIAATTVRV